jgi:hypothetical protein
MIPMRKILPILVLAVLAYGLFDNADVSIPGASVSTPADDGLVREAFENRKSDVQVHGKGRVVKVLPDDADGSRHQRFIVRLDSGQTLLIAHNIDLAPRIEGLRTADEVTFFGEYEWSSKGGVVHWTHADPLDRHPAGWVSHRGQRYQ